MRSINELGVLRFRRAFSDEADLMRVSRKLYCLLDFSMPWTDPCGVVVVVQVQVLVPMQSDGPGKARFQSIKLCLIYT